MKPTERFSSRVEDYVRYRPGYPATAISMLEQEIGFEPSWVVADIGSGPGNLTHPLFLHNGNPVVGVEPNKEMREAGERLLSSYCDFSSVDGTAEATGLEAGTIDLVVIGQAFHWFDLAATKLELQRILRPGGYGAIFYNNRRLGGGAFRQDYEDTLLRFCADYHLVRSRHVPEDARREFFAPEPMHEWKTPNDQWHDRDGFVGRVLSSSYVPQAGQPGHDEIMRALEDLFERHQIEGKVSFAYETQVNYGRLGVSGPA